MRQIFFTYSLLLLLTSCSNNLEEVEALVGGQSLNKEIATDVQILYSDSAYVKVIIESPLMIRYMSRDENIDEFPKGLHVRFLDQNGKEKSWMDANYAIREEKDGKIYAEDSVVVYNARNDKLRTDEIVWDEANEIIYTERAVKIMQPSRGDTILGFGLVANQEFTKFELKKRFSGIKGNFENLAKKLN